MLDFWYKMIDTLLPFDWTSFDFMKNALLAIILVSPLFGLLGTMIVSNKLAFFSDSLGHGAFTGIAIGATLGIVAPIWAAIVFSIFFAILITIIKNKSKSSPDTIIGVFSSTAIALGIMLISVNGQFNKLTTYLIGDLLSINGTDLFFLLLVFVVIILLWLIIYNKLLVISINNAFAKSKGINTFLYEIIFTIAVAVVVTITISWVGLLLVNSLLVLPAAAARNISNNTRQYHFFSILFAFLSGVLGLILSYYLNTSTGATIVMISALIFFISMPLKNKILG